MYSAATWTLRFLPIKHKSGPSQNINGTKRMRENSIAETNAWECARRTPRPASLQTPPPLRRWIRAFDPASALDRRQKQQAKSVIPPPQRACSTFQWPLHWAGVAAESFRRSSCGFQSPLHWAGFCSIRLRSISAGSVELNALFAACISGICFLFSK